MKVLLVWQIINGAYGAEFYLIDNPSESDLEHLKSANDSFINCEGETEHVNVINQYLSSKDSYCETPGAINNCKWYKCKVDAQNGVQITNRVDMIFTCGIIC